jgi:hypothetical protein
VYCSPDTGRAIRYGRVRRVRYISYIEKLRNIYTRKEERTVETADWGRGNHIKMALKDIIGSRNTSVGIATYNGLDGRGSIYDRRRKFFSSSQRPDRLWGH